MSRPTRLTPALTVAIARLVGDGLRPRAAAAAVGVDPNSLHRWSTRGRAAVAAVPEAERPFAAFWHAVRLAEVTAQARVVTRSAPVGAGWRGSAPSRGWRTEPEKVSSA